MVHHIAQLYVTFDPLISTHSQAHFSLHKSRLGTLVQWFRHVWPHRTYPSFKSLKQPVPLYSCPPSTRCHSTQTLGRLGTKMNDDIPLLCIDIKAPYTRHGLILVPRDTHISPRKWRPSAPLTDMCLMGTGPSSYRCWARDTGRTRTCKPNSHYTLLRRKCFHMVSDE